MVFVVWTSYFTFALIIYYVVNQMLTQSEAQRLKWAFAFSAIKTIAALALLLGLHFLEILPINKSNALSFIGFYFVHLVVTTLLGSRRSS